ncbi:hypothetical protein AB205_0138090 [Aquarana catesbeiana]|uniref:SKI/SNO/DAC domain-containing protein n=1 Tax=Aquarana catesbeiana TaxID=8400 RepID=A0A2G9QK91_AQUCT|nr:hypothetical protein AB205_0138090 [Aquarana catesbeiana]
MYWRIVQVAVAPPPLGVTTTRSRARSRQAALSGGFLAVIRCRCLINVLPGRAGAERSSSSSSRSPSPNFVVDLGRHSVSPSEGSHSPRAAAVSRGPISAVPGVPLMVEPCPVYPGVPRARCPVQEVCCVVSAGVSECIGRSSYVTMAVPAALIPPTQLVIATSAPSSSTSSSSSSPTPSITPSSSGPSLYRPEPIAATTVTSSLSSPPLTNISSTSSNPAAGAGGNNCSSNSPSLANTTNNNISHHHNPLSNTPSTSTSTTSTCTSSSSSAPNPNLPGKPVYSTPSPVENIPQNNECRMVDLRGAKVASFTVDGCELICLPQAFDLFLKHLVGGLHTVYTKLKRLEITPVVCNVEQDGCVSFHGKYSLIKKSHTSFYDLVLGNNSFAVHLLFQECIV